MEPEVPATRRLAVFADYGQFFVQDLDAHGIWMRSDGADPGLAPAGWTEEAVYGHRIGAEPYSLAIGTARRDSAEVSLRVFPRAPVADLGHRACRGGRSWPARRRPGHLRGRG